MLFIDGNHENFDKLNSYPIETWCGGKVHKIRNNVIHLMRGEVYCIEGNTIFVMGGGYSIDKSPSDRRSFLVAPGDAVRSGIPKCPCNLQRVNYQVDYIITHTAPSETVYYLSTLRSLGIKNNVTEELPLTIFLDDIQRKGDYRH